MAPTVELACCVLVTVVLPVTFNLFARVATPPIYAFLAAEIPPAVLIDPAVELASVLLPTVTSPEVEIVVEYVSHLLVELPRSTPFAEGIKPAVELPTPDCTISDVALISARVPLSSVLLVTVNELIVDVLRDSASSEARID